MSDNLQERPSFCDVPGGVKSPALKSQCKPDSMGQTPPNRPDIRSKALTDTDEKKKKLRKLGLTHEKKDTFQKFSNRIKGVDVDESTKEYAKSLEKIANDRALKMLSKSERENLKKIAVLLAKEEFYIDEANLNDYVKKFKMKMGDKTSTADKDAWVDGIGGLTKKEKTTLKRVLEEVEIVEDSRDKSKPDPKGRKHPEIKKDSEKAIALLKKKGIPAKYGNSMYFGDRIYVQRDMEAKAKKIVPKDLHQYVFGTIDNPVQAGFRTNEGRLGAVAGAIAGGLSGGPGGAVAGAIGGHIAGNVLGKVVGNTSRAILKHMAKKKEKDQRKQDDHNRHADAKRGMPPKPAKPYQPRTEDKMKTFSEISTGLLKRAASGARKDAATQRDAQDWATRVPGKGHAFGAAEAGKKAAKREKQAGKFSAAADVKDRNTSFKKEDNVNELGPIAGFVARAAVRHIAKKAVSKATSRKDEENVNELSKDLLQRAQQAAKTKAGQQRAVSKVAASRVGDTSQPPGQNLKSKRADYQASKKDYQAFKFGVAAKKKERVDESNKLQANMALDDAGIKSYWEDGKLWVDKKDVVKAEKTLAKSFKKGGEPHIYYKGGFLGVWNKKRKLTG